MIAILLILMQNTDKNHILTRDEILRMLEDQYETKIKRKLLFRTLKDLDDFQFIVVYDSSRKGYYLEKTIFEPGEIILLCNAIHNFGYISIQEVMPLLQSCRHSTAGFIRLSICRIS